jgi:hypothetical protein
MRTQSCGAAAVPGISVFSRKTAGVVVLSGNRYGQQDSYTAAGNTRCECHATGWPVWRVLDSIKGLVSDAEISMAITGKPTHFVILGKPMTEQLLVAFIVSLPTVVTEGCIRRQVCDQQRST